MTNQELLNKVANLVKPQYDSMNCWAHAWPHIASVKKTAEKLAKELGEDPTLPCIAAYCHDLGRIVEEKKGQVNNTLDVQTHAVLSIKPTVKVLHQVGIQGAQFDAIVEAVKVHSDKDYSGKNIIAKILRDADKKDGLGPFEILRDSKFYLGKDLVETQKIMLSLDDPKKIKLLADQTLDKIKNNEFLRKKFLKALDFTLEWVEKRMFDTEEAYKIVREDYEYSKKAQKFLSS